MKISADGWAEQEYAWESTFAGVQNSMQIARIMEGCIMGLPPRKLPKRLTTRIKGKPQLVDLSKSGIGHGKVMIDILTDKGHSIVEITRVDPPEEHLTEIPPDSTI